MILSWTHPTIHAYYIRVPPLPPRRYRADDEHAKEAYLKRVEARAKAFLQRRGMAASNEQALRRWAAALTSAESRAGPDVACVLGKLIRGLRAKIQEWWDMEQLCRQEALHLRMTQ